MLHNIKMKVIKTAPNGIVNSETIFEFTQNENVVTANYAGGKISKGFLVGNLNQENLKFTYCQMRMDGRMDHGESSCTISKENGKITLTEHFEMTTDSELAQGVNVFQEL